jgi:hypothetical protein
MNTASGPKKKVKQDTCRRCGITGHNFYECSAILCDYCEETGHKSEDCHLLSAPKPQLILHGIADEKLMFFECPVTKSSRPKLESNRLGLLSVTGGELSIPQIVTQLQRLIPMNNFQWDCRQVGHNVFKVSFPDKEELERLARFGTFHVPNSQIQLTFEQCVSAMEPVCKLPEIWVVMNGIPPKRKGDFLAMWSLGTLFGKTLKVDMKYTREKGALRILIGCLDYRRIPAKERIFIVDGFYDISFEYEAPRDLEMPAAPSVDDDPSDNSGNGNHGDNGNFDTHHGKDDMETDQNPKQTPDNGGKGSTSSGTDVNKLASNFSSGVKFSPQVKKMMERSREELRSFVASLPIAEPALVLDIDSLEGGSDQVSGHAGQAAVMPATADFPVELAAAQTTSAISSAAAGDTASLGAQRGYPAAAALATAEFSATTAAVEPNHSRPLPMPAASGSTGTGSFRASSTSTPAKPKTVQRQIVSPPHGSPAASTPAPHHSAARNTGCPPQTRQLSISPLLTSNPSLSKGSPLAATACGSGWLGQSKVDVHSQTGEPVLISPAQELDGRAKLSPPRCVRVHTFSSEKLDPNSRQRMAAASSPEVAVSKKAPRTAAKIIAFGGIEDPSTAVTKSSGWVRSQDNADATQLERAIRIAAKRNSITPQGTLKPSKLSFTCLSNEVIEERALNTSRKTVFSPGW